MSKKVLILSSSYHKNSNSEALADAFAEGAAEAGHEVKKIRLADCRIGFCRGCLVCQETQKCVIADDAADIAEQMGQADVLVFATPIYYYEMSGQLKTMLDRANPLFPSDYRFREVYLIAAATEDETETPKNAENGVRGWVECFEKARFAGTIFCGGVTEGGEIRGSERLGEAKRAGAEI